MQKEEQNEIYVKLNDCIISVEDRERYGRQLILKELSIEKQEQILKSQILIIGAGGLGCPCLVYLLGCGFRNITIVDQDKVDVSNLHRQILFGEKHQGQLKVESAKESLLELDGQAKIKIISEKLTQKNYEKIMQGQDYKVIIDCSDNAVCKYLCNDIAVQYQIPYICGAALMWEGQLMVFDPLSTLNNSCYRCIYPRCAGQQGACNEQGVVGMCVGIIGQLQALECLKIIINREKYQTGHLLIFDGLSLTFRKAKMRQQSSTCISCSHQIDISNYDYESFVNDFKPSQCLISFDLSDHQHQKYQDITWQQFNQLIKQKDNHNLVDTLIDVRNSNMFKIINLQKFINVPLENIKSALNQQSMINLLKISQNSSKHIYVMCKKGVASKNAAKILSQVLPDFQIFNIQGGIEQYSKIFNQSIPFI